VPESQTAEPLPGRSVMVISKLDTVVGGLEKKLTVIFGEHVKVSNLFDLATVRVFRNRADIEDP
jgi:small basic protein